MDQPEPLSESVRARMSNTPQRDTPAELALRRELHSRGYRYRVNWPVPEVTRCRPDLAFRRHKVAVFVDGCFWHRCPQHGTVPVNNQAWWETKLSANVERDERQSRALRATGWRVIRLWEHESPQSAADRVIAVLDEAR